MLTTQKQLLNHPMEYQCMISEFKKGLNLMIYHQVQGHIKWGQYLKAHLSANHFEMVLKQLLFTECF